MSEDLTEVDDADLTDGLDDEPFEQQGPDLFGAPESADAAPESSTDSWSHAALYRRYRPDTFDEIIGQDHVTEPLKRALANNKVAHAYLFSGPRGCGKTTSARILARCLNCVTGPTPTPCGECDSCRDLATGGPGSIDVIEMDAASHGGVDDARDLRERAFFAPVASRYKIYIVDEAHMVTQQGFNALLKIVEEPPPHVKFIFATTEPDKVIGTIRSRTHHYPFRLVPPKTLTEYLESICRQEGIDVDHAALPLVVRAGAGSVRDSLSILDQLLGSADEGKVSYQQASSLLGYTPDSLLDEVMDAFAARDAHTVFSCIDKVIEVGQDPRRFAEDLLHRLRDLVIVANVADAVSSGLIDVAADQAERLQTQAAGMGSAELTRAAGVVASGLTDMRGTTTPRLHLELMCSRILIPRADASELGLVARMERVERRLSMPQGETAPIPSAVETPSAPAVEQPTPPDEAMPPAQTPPAPRPSEQRPADQRRAGQRPAGQRPAQRAPEPEPEPTPAAPPAAPTASTGGMTLADLRREWPGVLENVKSRRRFAWMVLSNNVQVTGLDQGVITLEFNNPGARASFESGGSGDVLAEALIATLGLDVRIRMVDEGESAPAPQRDRSVGPEPEPEPADFSDDVVVDESGESAVELVKRTLGAEVIAEE